MHVLDRYRVTIVGVDIQARFECKQLGKREKRDREREKKKIERKREREKRSVSYKFANEPVQTRNPFPLLW